MRIQTSRRNRSLLAVLPVLLALGALPLIANGPSPAVPAKPDDKTIIHVLNRIGFGPRPGDIERVRSMGLQAYIDEQLHPDRIQDEGMSARLASLETLSKSSRELAEEYLIPAQMMRRAAKRKAAPTGSEMPAGPEPSGAPEQKTPEQVEAARSARRILTDLTEQKVLRAAYSERQLDEVMVDFWFNHFNVFAGKGATRGYVTEYERDAIRPHALGKFRELLGATAESPAMLFFLDNWQSAAAMDSTTADSRGAGMNRPRASPNPRRRGLLRAPRPDAQNPPTAGAALPPAQNRRPRGLNENYARELMELHTLGVEGGYTQKDVQEVARALTGWTIQNPRLGGGFRFDPRLHDSGEKLVLGHRIKAGGGQEDGEQVLDILAQHPSTARFISTKLARRFVADAPPATLVDRAAKRFQETGGDIREVVRTIITSPEFFAADAYRAKVKTPFEFVVSAVRATGTEVANGVPLAAATRELGMPLYMCQPPTGYADRADAWVNTGALLNRMNFALSLTGNRFRGGGENAMRTSDPNAARDALVQGALGGDLSQATAATIAGAQQTPQVIALVLGSPEFQRR